MKSVSLFFWFWIIAAAAFGQVTVEIDLSAQRHTVSPYIYGRNNSVSDNPSSPVSAQAWLKLKDAGVTFLRENGGNNATKFNWRRRLSSHPDWYNNVYAHNWDYAAQSIQQNLPQAQGMWAFQLIGKAAKTSAANFNDWGYNQSQWWTGVNQNLAGGGTPKTSGGADAQVEGNPDLYLETWTADSTVGILDHWFGSNSIGLNENKILYWSMDNEAEIWSGTHDDIMPAQVSAENFMQSYFNVAKKARAKFPEIRLVGPVTANEWQWYNWNNSPINSGGVNYPWLKYFIKRVAEEQQASGIRLLDVLDIHFYPSNTTVANVVQYHRVFFDKNYIFPEANGVKNVSGSWDDSQNKEYILERCRAWLEQYMGPGHGVKFSVTETGIPDIGPNGIAVWYASTLGEFMRQSDMEIFAPWHWYPQMWEVLHLFSRYNKTEYVKSTSSDETLISAYPTINAAEDSITVVLVNRAGTSKTVNLNFKGFALASQGFSMFRLSSLSTSETFVSHQTNALQKTVVQKNGNSLDLSLPALSTTSVILVGIKDELVTGTEDVTDKSVWQVFPNPTQSARVVRIKINKTGMATVDLLDITGKTLSNIDQGRIASSPVTKEVDLSAFPVGTYLIRLTLDGNTYTKKFIRR